MNRRLDVKFELLHTLRSSPFVIFLHLQHQQFDSFPLPFHPLHLPTNPFSARPVDHPARQDPPAGDLGPQLGQDDSLVEGVEGGVCPLCEEL